MLYLDPNIDLSQYASSSARMAYLKTGLHRSRHRFLFVLDGLEVLQHPEGDDYGLFTSVDLKNWLRDFAEATHSSFCLITTRAPLLDLIDYSTYTHREVERLSDSEGVELLQKLGVRGSEPDRSDLRRVVQQWGGYALVLSLLGSYLVDHHDGDIRQLPANLAPTATETKYDRVSRVLRRYDEVLTPQERSFLERFSAFRLPVPAAALEILSSSTGETEFPSPGSPKLGETEPLNPPNLGDLGGKQTLAIAHRLVSYRILHHNAGNSTYTIHPLIRKHYLQRLKQARDRTTTLHRQIADLYLTTAGETPRFPTLNDLTPLIEAVHHRCQAGDYDEANIIRRDRIHQGDLAVLIHQLGAYDADLTLMQEFFLEGDTTQNPQVSDPDAQCFVLNHIGLCLMSLGRLGEAPSFYERAAAGYVSGEKWSFASAIYHNLAILYIYLGNFPASASAVESALLYARRGNDQGSEQFSLGLQAWVDHLLGHLDTATDVFQQAAALLHPREPDKQYLYGLVGIKHADHLHRWGDADYARRITEANRSICERSHWVEQLSLCHRAMGDLDAASKLSTAQYYYNEALQIARSISERSVLIEALLARGRWAARQGNAAAASSDLEEALGYAVAGGYRLYEADIRMGLAWMHRAAGNLDAARLEAERAQRMSEAMGYYWGQKDAAEVLEALEQVA